MWQFSSIPCRAVQDLGGIDDVPRLSIVLYFQYYLWLVNVDTVLLAEVCGLGGWYNPCCAATACVAGAIPEVTWGGATSSGEPS